VTGYVAKRRYCIGPYDGNACLWVLVERHDKIWILRNLDDFGNDELQKSLDETDTEESLLRIIEVA